MRKAGLSELQASRCRGWHLIAVKRKGRDALAALSSTARGRQLAGSLWASAGVQLALVGSGILAARSLGPAGRGDLALILLLPAVATQLVCLGIPAAATYFIARQREAWRTVMRHVGTVAVTQVFASLVLLYLLDLIFLADKSDSAKEAAVVAAASVPVLVANFYGLAILQGLGKLRWFNVYRVAGPGLFTLVLVAVISLSGLSILVCTVAWLSAQVAVALAIYGQLLRHARSHLQTESVVEKAPTRPEVLRFGAAGFLAQVSPVESFRVDQLATALLFSSEILGYYVVASSVSNIPRFLADGIAAVAYPDVSARPALEAAGTARRYLIVAAALCGGAAVVTALALPWVIPLLFGDRFTQAIGIGVILVVAAGLVSIRRVSSDCLRALGRPGAATSNEILKWTLLLPAFLTIGRWGEGKGVAISLVIASAVALGLLVRVLYHRHADTKAVALES